MKTANLWLESKILERIKELSASNESISAYLKVNADEIEPSLRSTINSIGKLGTARNSKENVSILYELGGKLKTAFKVVKSKFHSSELIQEYE